MFGFRAFRRLSVSGRRSSISNVALHLAESAKSDEQVVGRLRSMVEDDPGEARAALAGFGRRRTRFDYDRAYRLLDAALVDDPVEPIAEEKRELFTREEALGRMPLKDAFAYVAKLEPHLRDLEDAVGGSSAASEKIPSYASTMLLEREEPDSLLESEFTRALCVQYLEILAGFSSGDVACPFFELSGKKVILTTRLHTF
jgi:hypothetical protein